MRLAKWSGTVVFVIACGCGRTEWNWDWAWWQSPSRIVPPSKTESDRPVSAATSRHSEAVEAAASAQDEPSREQFPTRQQQNRPFYQLYLVGPDAEAGDQGDATVHLHFAKARPCAVLLEMLCVPLGRSGNPAKCYLLYEEKSELDDAIQIAPLLDIAAATAPRSTSGPSESFDLGVGLMLTIVEQAAVVDATLVNAAVKLLTQAMQADSLDTERRWAAGVLASRLMCEFKYDHGSARLLAQDAESIAVPGSREQYTAMYWRADALTQSGKSAEATSLYQEIAKKYGVKVAHSQLVKQPKASSKGGRKRGRLDQ